MASNPYMSSPLITGALAGYQGWKNQVAENDAKKLQKDQLAWQRQQYTDVQGQKTQQAQFERIKAANAEADKAVSDFDNASNANDPNQLYGQVSQIESMYGLAPGSILGRVRAGRGGALGTSPPASMGSGNLGTAPPKDMGSGDLGMAPGSPGNPVDANPIPMPPQQGPPQIPMVPPGAGLPPPRDFSAQPMPSIPPNALQALGARGIGPGGIPTMPQRPYFQMPNPLANGAPGPPQPFGPVPQAPQGSLTPSDMQTPAGSQPWQGAPQGVPGQLSQSPFRGPWGSKQTGLVPVGSDPIATAQSAVDRANANLQALSPFAGHATRANAERAVKDAVTDLTAARRDQLSGQTEFNKLRVASAGGKLPAGTLLDSANDLRPLGYNVNIPLHTIDRGLQPEEWDKIDRVAQAAYDANPKTWQDTQYNGHPLSYYLDENGNRQQIADVDQSQVAQDTHAKTLEQTSDMKSRQSLTEATRRYLENTKTPQAQAQTKMVLANLDYLQKVKTPETQAITKLITEGKIPAAVLGITKLNQELSGTYNPSSASGGSKDYNKVQAAQASVLGRINSMLKDPITGGSIDPNSLAPDQKAIYTQLQQQNQEYNRQLAGMAKQSGSVKGVNIPVAPASVTGAAVAQKAAAMQPQVCKNPDDRKCQAHAREAMQSAIPGAYDGIWDRSPDATAKSNLQRFIQRGIAKPYTPGMPIPPGSILYSTKLGEGSGHASIAGMQGQRYDQHGVNAFLPSDYNWFVPPPQGAPSGKFPGPGQMMTPPRKTASNPGRARLNSLLGIR